MKEATCKGCKQQVELWNKNCRGCGFVLVLEPEEKIKQRYLRGPALGALLWTQGWTFGARLYLWFVLSLIPVFGLIALFACLFFGRRWAWKAGGWSDWDEFTERMKLMDALSIVWIVGLLGFYLYARSTGGL